MIKLGKIVKELQNEWISHSPAINRNPDDKLRPIPGGWNDDTPNWDGMIEHKDWFCHVEGNDWHKKQSGAAVYINEDEKPYKMWIKIKTHGLRKTGDTNESFKERIRKHSDKVARTWVSEAKRIYKNVDLNEVGNPIPVTWKHAFKEALNNIKVKSQLVDCGEGAIADPVNFTPRA